MKYFRDSDLDAELALVGKPPAYEVEFGYPLGELTDRQFECLLYDIYKADLKEQKCEGRFDAVVLMLGVADRGRDCALLRNGKHVGVVQCKRYDGLITKPDAVREILKFVLHAMKDNSLMPEPKGFLYVFATSRDFNGKAKELLASFREHVVQEPQLEEWATEVIEENEGLTGLTYADVRDNLLQILMTIDVQPLNRNDINTELVGRSIIIEKYFAVKKVISEEGTAEIKSMLQSVLSKIADEDVARLLDKLQKTADNRRFDIGLLSFWGYPQAFLDLLINRKDLGPIATEIAMAKSKLDLAFLEFLRDRIGEAVFQQITVRGDISPFTIQAVVPFVFGKLSRRFLERVSGKVMTNEIMRKPDTDILAIKQQLLTTAEAVLRNDFSGFAAQGSALSAVKEVSAFIHRGFQTVDQMSQRFDADWIKIVPIVSQIERDLEGLIPDGPVVVIRSLNWFDDRGHLGKIVERLSAYDKKGKSRSGDDNYLEGL